MSIVIAILITILVMVGIVNPGVGIIIALVVGGIIYAVIKNGRETARTNENMRSEVLKGFDVEITKDIYQHSFMISKDRKRLAVLYNGAEKIEHPKILDIDKLKECQVLQDGSTIIKNAIGRAVVGGVIAGGTGAIIGTNSGKQINQVESIELRFLTKDLHNPIIRIPIYQRNEFLEVNIKFLIESCEELIATLNMLINEDYEEYQEEIEEYEDEEIEDYELECPCCGEELSEDMNECPSCGLHFAG